MSNVSPDGSNNGWRPYTMTFAVRGPHQDPHTATPRPTDHITTTRNQSCRRFKVARANLTQATQRTLIVVQFNAIKLSPDLPNWAAFGVQLNRFPTLLRTISITT